MQIKQSKTLIVPLRIQGKELENLLLMGENEDLLVRWMKTLIPEFISKNSRFELLDINGKSF